VELPITVKPFFGAPSAAPGERTATRSS
jgi:hypothetical protein